MRKGLRGPSFRVILLSLLAVLCATAKHKPDNVAVQGKVFLIDKNTSTIMVDTKADGRRLVVYSPNTRVEYGRSGKGREVPVDQIKPADYISCTGSLDDRERLIAGQCICRESK